MSCGEVVGAAEGDGGLRRRQYYRIGRCHDILQPFQSEDCLHFSGMRSMTRSLARAFGFAVSFAAAVVQPALAVEISPHRALYTMSRDTAKPGSGVVNATGAMVYEWGETCDGWTVQQRFRLRLMYEDSDPVELSSTLVSWESKDGLRYRFNERRLKNGEADEEVKGEAKL